MSIKILPQQVSDQIAAGEVVERPASVVKELIENSLDAGADDIEIIIDEGGKKRICVKDNGHGMGAPDLKKSILRHATSKIESIEDLFSVLSFGFRGEALAAIASVSRCRITSKRPKDDEGSTLLVEGGTVIEEDVVASSDGTSVDIRDLFYITPARLEYLKTDNTEYRHILHEVQCFALGNPSVRFTVFKDGKQTVQYSPTQDIQRIGQVLHMETKVFLEVKKQVSTMRISGIIGKPEKSQKSRSNQFLFVNGRAIEDFRIAHSIRESYMRSCGIDKALYPFFALFLDIDPLLVDINVHPRKREVKFSDPQDVYKFVQATMVEVLNGYSYDSPSVQPYKSPPSFSVSGRPSGTSLKAAGSFNQSLSFGERHENQEKGNVTLSFQDAYDPAVNKRELMTDQGSHPELVEESSEQLHSLRLIGQCANKYILAESEGGLYVFDQHALHERLRYNKFLKQAEKKDIEIQKLLVPQIFQMSATDILLLQEQKSFLAELGIDFEVKENDIVLKALPVLLQKDSEYLFEDFVRYFEKEQTGEQSFERALRIMLEYKSCRGSVFFGDKLERPEMQQLLDEFVSGNWKLLCPHGRPNHIFWKFEDIDKGFYR